MRKLLFIIISIFLMTFVMSCQTHSKSTYELYVELLNENYDSDICVYGQNIDFEYDLDYLKTDNIQACNFKSDYNYLVINFDDGQFDLIESDLNYILNLMTENVKIIFVNINDYSNQITSIENELIDWDRDIENAEIVLIDTENNYSLSSNSSNDFIILDFIIRSIKSYN